MRIAKAQSMPAPQNPKRPLNNKAKYPGEVMQFSLVLMEGDVLSSDAPWPPTMANLRTLFPSMDCRDSLIIDYVNLREAELPGIGRVITVTGDRAGVQIPKHASLAAIK